MTVNRDRQMIAVEHAKFDLDYNTLDEVLARFQKYREEVGGNAFFETRFYSYNDNTYMALMTTRPETDAEMAQRIKIEEYAAAKTDAEMAQRIKIEEYAAAKTEDAERKEFERLAKKFGKA